MLDTLSLARELHPGQRNSLDALCKRYEIDASPRSLHGALIDADLLARVYLAMTGGQTALTLDGDAGRTDADGSAALLASRPAGKVDLVVIRASDEEAAAHEAFLERLRAGGSCVWDRSAEH